MKNVKFLDLTTHVPTATGEAVGAYPIPYLGSPGFFCANTSDQSLNAKIAMKSTTATADATKAVPRADLSRPVAGSFTSVDVCLGVVVSNLRSKLAGAQRSAHFRFPSRRQGLMTSEWANGRSWSVTEGNLIFWFIFFHISLSLVSFARLPAPNHRIHYQ